MTSRRLRALLAFVIVGAWSAFAFVFFATDAGAIVRCSISGGTFLRVDVAGAVISDDGRMRPVQTRATVCVPRDASASDETAPT
jgi:hypothetical protein